MSFINSQSFKCLLGPQSKDVAIVNSLNPDNLNNSIYTWKVGKKQHFTTDRNLIINDLDLLNSLSPSNFHYLSEQNILFLKQHFKVSKSKNTSITINIENLSFAGNDNKSIRHCLNRCAKENFTIETDYRSLDDIKKLIEEWSNDYTEKYFRDNSGKNTFFYKNNFHKDLISTFIYKDSDLIAFGTLSNHIDGLSSYVLGKALFKRYYGLSEYADVQLYKLGQIAGIKTVNMGAATKGLLTYKTKFDHTKETHYDGNIEKF